MPDDRDRRRPIGPPPGVPAPMEFSPEENTGQHVRTQLIAFDQKLTQAIRVDVEDHADMKNTMNEHRRQSRQELDAFATKFTGKLDAVSMQIGAMRTAQDAQGTTLDVIHESIKMRNTDENLKKQHVVEVTTHEKKVNIDDAADVRKKRRDIMYGVGKVIAIALTTWALAHYLHLH